MKKIAIVFVILGLLLALRVFLWEQEGNGSEQIAYEPKVEQVTSEDTLLNIGIREIWDIDAVKDIQPFAIVEYDSISFEQYKAKIASQLFEGDTLTLLFTLEAPNGNVSLVQVDKVTGSFATMTDVSEYFSPLLFHIQKDSPFAEPGEVTVKLSFTK